MKTEESSVEHTELEENGEANYSVTEVMRAKKNGL